MAPYKSPIAKAISVLIILLEQRNIVQTALLANAHEQIAARKRIMATKWGAILDEATPVVALGRVTVEHDIYGMQVAALEAEVAACVAKKAELDKKDKVLEDKLKVVEDWLEARGLDRESGMTKEDARAYRAGRR